MLFEISKKNVELNNFYNAITNEKARYETEYERLKKRVEELEDLSENVNEHKNVKSLDVFVKSVRDASIKIDVSLMIIVATSKKLLDSLILTDDKNLNIED
jgi:site-specific DNA-adenine methylase